MLVYTVLIVAVADNNPFTLRFIISYYLLHSKFPQKFLWLYSLLHHVKFQNKRLQRA